MSLPGNVPAKLRSALEAHDAETQDLFLRHLLGGTSSEFLAESFSAVGYPVGSTTIKRYRRHLQDIGKGVQV